MFSGRAGKKVKWPTVDTHCHILPGLDDGAENMAETLDMLRRAADEGISYVAATPHFRPGRFTPQPEEILRQTERVRQAANQEKIPVRLFPGSEIYYFEGMVSCLRQQRLCTLNASSCVLIEFSPAVLFRTLQNAMDEVLSGGYLPILAHAERYACLLQNAENAVFLHNMGVRLQVNASAVTGEGGAQEKRFVQRLMKANAADCIGTDAHGALRRAPEIRACREKLIRRYGDSFASQVLGGAAKEMFGL